MNKLPLILSIINLLLLFVLCFYAWTQKNYNQQTEDRFDRATSKIEVVTDDVVKLRLEFESQSNGFASGILNQEAALQKLNQFHQGQLEELDGNNRALSVEIQDLSRRHADLEELKQVVSQFQSLEARLQMIEIENKARGDIKLSRSRLDELENASVALLENALLK